jgi:FecR protein
MFTASISWIGRVALAALAGVVCALPLAAQDRPVAVVEQMMGQVSLMRDGHIDIPLTVGSGVKAQQEIVTGPDSYARFRLQDNSTFEIYEKSTAVFKPDYPGGWQNLLNLVMGRVKVFIDHSKGPNNNSVSTPTAVISVRGTVFDVVVEDADGTTLVSCDEGLVQIRNVTAPGAEPLLRPGESYRIFRGQGILGKQINKGPIVQIALRALRDAALTAIQHQAPGGVPVGGAGGGAQGDKGKGGNAPPPAPTGNGH